MNDIDKSLFNMNNMDEMSLNNTILHRVHPFAKLIVTILYIIFVLSIDKYDIGGHLPFIFYIIIYFILSDIPFGALFKRSLIAIPFVLGIGIFDLILNKKVFIDLMNIKITYGFISFLTLFIKTELTVLASLLFVSTTGIYKIALSLKMIKVPEIIIFQILLTYRYINLLINEIKRAYIAYRLRSPQTNGLKKEVWGSFLGNILIRTMEKANMIYLAMKLRGGKFSVGILPRMYIFDYLYIIFWLLFFIIIRCFNIVEYLGNLVF